MDILEKLKQLKEASLFKQSLVAVTVILAIITFINNYSTVRDDIKKLAERVRTDENLKLFVNDVVSIIRPFVTKVENLLHNKEAGK